MDENSEQPPAAVDEVPESDTQPLSQDEESLDPQVSQQSEDQTDFEPESDTQNVYNDDSQDRGYENHPPEESPHRHRSHRERSSRHRSHKHHHHKRSRRHREEYPPEEEEDPIPRDHGDRMEATHGESGGKEMEDGEILEDGEIATDDEEDGEEQERDLREAKSRTSIEEEEVDEGPAGGESDGEQPAMNNENEGRERPRRDHKKKRKERDKRRREKEEKKKSRRHAYVDHDRMDEDGNRWSGYPDEDDEYGGRYHNPHYPSPVKRDPYYYGGRESPPGLYDSPSEESDEDRSNNQPSMTSLVSDEFLDASVAANEKDQLRAKIMKSRDKKRSRLGGKRKAESLRHPEQPKKRPLLEIPMAERPVCKFFKDGKCAKGSLCPFNHDFKPKRFEICKFYLSQDGCTRGENCIYMHGDYPCKYFHTGAPCYSGDNCRFSHDPLTDETKRIVDEMLHGKSRDADGFEMDRPKKPSLLGDPPKHVKEAAERAKEIKKIPSLFDIEVFPPGHKPPSVPTGFYSELGAKSPPSDGILDSPAVSSQGISSQSMSPASSHSSNTPIQASPSLLGSPPQTSMGGVGPGGIRNNGPMMMAGPQGPMGRPMMGPRGPVFGMNTGPQQGMNPRMQQGMNPGMNMNMQQGMMNPGMNQNMRQVMPNIQQGMNSGMQQGMNPNMQQGMNPNMQQGMNSGMQQGMNPNMQQGMNPRMQGMNPGVQGMNPGMQQGMGANMQGMQQRIPGQGMQGMNPGMRPGMMQQGMNQNMQPGVNQNMQPGMNQNMQPGMNMPQGMNQNMQPGMNMSQGMNQNMQQGVNQNMAQGINQNMPPSMNMQQGMNQNMQQGMMNPNQQGMMNHNQQGMSPNMRGMTPNVSQGMNPGMQGMNPRFGFGVGGQQTASSMPPVFNMINALLRGSQPGNFNNNQNVPGSQQQQQQQVPEPTVPQDTDMRKDVDMRKGNGPVPAVQEQPPVSGPSMQDNTMAMEQGNVDDTNVPQSQNSSVDASAQEPKTEADDSQTEGASPDDSAAAAGPSSTQPNTGLSDDDKSGDEEQKASWDSQQSQGSPGESSQAEDDDSLSAQKTQIEKDEEASLMHLPPKQRQLFMRIRQQQQHQAQQQMEEDEAMDSDSAASKNDKDEEKPEVKTKKMDDDDDWYSSDEDDSGKPKAKLTDILKTITSMPVATGASVAQAGSAPSSSTSIAPTFDVMQMIQSIRSQAQTSTADKPPVQSTPQGPGTSSVASSSGGPVKRDPRQRPADPSRGGVSTTESQPAQIPANIALPPLPTLFVDPPVIDAAHTPVTYRLSPLSIQVVKPYWSLPPGVDPAEAPHNVDPRVKEHHKLVAERGPEPKSTCSVKPNDPRLSRRPSATNEGGNSPSSRPNDPRLRRSGSKDPRLQAQQDPRSQGMGPQDPRMQNMPGQDPRMQNMPGQQNMPWMQNSMGGGGSGGGGVMNQGGMVGPGNMMQQPNNMGPDSRFQGGMMSGPHMIHNEPWNGPVGMQGGPMGMQQTRRGPMGMQQGPMGMQQSPMGMQQCPMGMQQGPLGMQQGPMGMQQGPNMGMQQGPKMVMQQGPNMGMQQGPNMGMQQGPNMGMQQGPNMGMQPGPNMGMQPGPNMGMQQGPNMGMQPGPNMGMQQGPNMGMQQGPNMGMQQGPNMGIQQGPMGMQQGPNMGMQSGPMGKQQDPRQGSMGCQGGPMGPGPMNGPISGQQGPLGAQQDPRQGPSVQRGSSNPRMMRGQGNDPRQGRQGMGSAVDPRVVRLGQDSQASPGSSPRPDDPYLSPSHRPQHEDAVLPQGECGDQSDSAERESGSESFAHPLPPALREPPPRSETDTGAGDDGSSADEIKASKKKFDYRNDPRFKRKPASESTGEDSARKFRGQRKSSMEYASPLSSDDLNSSSESGYNSYNRPPLGRDSRQVPRDKNNTFELPHMEMPPVTLQRPQTQTPPPDQTAPPDLFPSAPEPQLKDLFKTIDPTASPFC